MNYNVIYPEIDDCLNKYRCVVNGNDVIAVDSNFKVIRRKCQSLACRGFYVEMWYTYSDGRSRLVNYWI